ncbi:MAG: hypothetical protein U5Q44_12020 [Dehalococcoidia bacterium]|nr:hypothetical protein [Dehalococcoidia bacterium]
MAEIEGNGQCTVDSTATDYQTHALVTYGEEPSASDLASAPLVADGQVSYDVRKGETTYVAFANRGCGQVLASANLFVENFASPDGSFGGDEPLAGWSITATGTGGLAEGFEGRPETDASGMAALPRRANRHLHHLRNSAGRLRGRRLHRR